jgi:hypothetical protein
LSRPSAAASIRFNREFDSNEIDGRELRGISIDGSDEYENASDSIRVDREFEVNEIDESDLRCDGETERT